MKRQIIHIDQEKCNGCGACAAACHEGAIAMAQDVTATTMDPQVKSLAANIISSQQAEIDTMQGMLAAGQ